MKKKLVFALLIFMGLTAVIVKANQQEDPSKETAPHKVKVTIVKDQNGQVSKSEEVIEVSSRKEIHDYLASKDIDLKEMEIYKKRDNRSAIHRMHGGHDVWVFNRSGNEARQRVMVISETNDDEVEGAVEEKVVVKKIEIQSDEGNIEDQEIRIEKRVDENGEVTIKKYVNGEEVDPNTKIHSPRAQVKMMEEGGEMEIVVETSDEDEPKTIKIKKEMDENGNMKVYKSVNGGEFEEVDHGKHQTMRWKEKGHHHHSGFAARSEDGSTMVFVSRVKEDKQAKKEQTMTAEQTLNLSDVKFFPNPSDGRFSLSFNTPQEGPVNITITDLQGREILKKEIKNWNGTQEFELNESETGMYLVKIEQEGQVYSHRLMIH